MSFQAALSVAGCIVLAILLPVVATVYGPRVAVYCIGTFVFGVAIGLQLPGLMR